MSVRTSYSYQKELLMKLKESLDTFKSEMVNVVVNYKDTVQKLHEEDGLMEEIYDEYCIQHLNPTIETLNAMFEGLDNTDSEFIDKEIAYIDNRPTR